MSYNPPVPIPNPNDFNYNYFTNLGEGLTIDTADKRYLKLSGGSVGYLNVLTNLNVLGEYYKNSELVNLDAITGITPGIASASKALIIDSSRNLNNLNQLSLTGKLVLDQTQSLIGFYRNTSTLDINSYIAPESGNTANLTLYSLRGNGSIKLLANNTGTNTLFLINATSSTTPSATNLLTLYGNGNLGIGLNNPAYRLDVAGEINSNTNIQVNRSSNGECFICSNSTVQLAIHLTTNNAHIGTTTSGHNFNIQTNGSNVIQCLSTGSVNIPTHNGSTLGLQLNGTLVTSTATELNYLSGITLGTITGSKAITVDSNNNVNSILRITCNNPGTGYLTCQQWTNTFNFVGARLYMTSVDSAIGTSTNNPFNIVSNNINAIECDTSQNVNIPVGLKLAGTLITATATELNYNDITTIGSGEANKTLVLDSNRDIINIRKMTLNGTGDILTLSNNTATERLSIKFLGDSTSIWELGTRNASSSPVSSFYIYDGVALAMRLIIDNQGSINIVNHNGSTTGLQLNGTLITATATEINYLDVATIGTAEASKALVLNSSRNITNINSITTNFLNFNNNISGSTTSGSISGYKFNSGQVSNNLGMISVKGSTAVDSPVWGTDNSILFIESSNNTSTLEAEINISSGLASTSTNALRMGTISNNDFVLFTNGTERCRLRSGGAFSIGSVLQIGTSTDTSRLISALDSSMTAGSARYITLGRSNDSGNQAEIAFSYSGSNSNDNALTLGFYGGERARLTRYGSFCVGTGTQSSFGGFRGITCLAAGGASEWLGAWRNNANSNNRCIALYDLNDTEKGGITWGTGTTAFNTSSDYRLKKDIIPLINGLELINNLNPVRFKWKDSDMEAEGFIAHELQEHLPHCVDGEKDGVYSNGSIKYQSVDYGKITTTLVSAIKELTTRLKNLEDFISTLDIEEVPII